MKSFLFLCALVSALTMGGSALAGDRSYRNRYYDASTGTYWTYYDAYTGEPISYERYQQQLADYESFYGRSYRRSSDRYYSGDYYNTGTLHLYGPRINTLNNYGTVHIHPR